MKKLVLLLVLPLFTTACTTIAEVGTGVIEEGEEVIRMAERGTHLTERAARAAQRQKRTAQAVNAARPISYGIVVRNDTPLLVGVQLPPYHMETSFLAPGEDVIFPVDLGWFTDQRELTIVAIPYTPSSEEEYQVLIGGTGTERIRLQKPRAGVAPSNPIVLIGMNSRHGTTELRPRIVR